MTKSRYGIGHEAAPGQLHRLVSAAAFAIPLFYAIISLIAPPMLWSDSASGFLVWTSMDTGAAWNCYFTPDSNDIARDIQSFRTWWSPGQYLFTGWLTITGLSLGRALTVTALFGSWLGLEGFRRLYAHLGFSPAVVAWSLIVIATGWLFAWPFGIFIGGELVLFAGFPWIVLIALKLESRPWLQTAALPVLFLFGALLKLSFPIIALSVLAGLWFVRHRWIWPLTSTKILDSARLAVVMALFYATLWAVFLSKGPTPSSGHAEAIVPFSHWSAVVLLGPFSGLTSIGSALARIFFFPGHSLLSNSAQLSALLWALVPLALGAYLLAWRGGPSRAYGALFAGFLLVYIALFGWLYATGRAVSLEDRHFRPAALLLLPGLMHVIASHQARWVRVALTATLILSGSYGVASFFNRAHHIHRIANVGAHGFTQHSISPGALAALHRLDVALPAGNNLVVTSSPEIALELQHVRVLSTHAEMESLAWLGSQKYRGRVDRLVVVISDQESRKGKAQALLSSIVDYAPESWGDHVVDGWHFFHQGVDLPSLLATAQ